MLGRGMQQETETETEVRVCWDVGRSKGVGAVQGTVVRKQKGRCERRTDSRTTAIPMGELVARNPESPLAGASYKASCWATVRGWR